MKAPNKQDKPIAIEVVPIKSDKAATGTDISLATPPNPCAAKPVATHNKPVKKKIIRKKFNISVIYNL